ncbi:MAG: thioesterase domain-containing protein, partial [Sulfitobacter sp.]|nr:thioesterase domain-containing protein [Sulfitobacter sp.]
ARCPHRAEAAAGDRLRAAQEGHLNFGPNWHVLQSTALGTGEGLASLQLPEGAQGEDHLLHAGLLDIATGWAMHLIPGYGAAHLWVPLSYASLRIHAPLTRAIRSWARLVEADSAKGQARFDVTLTDPQGRVLVEVEGFAMQRLEGGFAIPPLSASEVRFDGDASGTEALTPAEERLAWLVSQGIRRDEGPQALRRALAANRSQIVVSSMPLPGLVAQADTPPLESRGSGQSFERPDLDGSFVAPRNGVEAGLAEIWEGLLGVSPVGVEDSFFDLGGHSLIAVRLFAAVKRRFLVEFPISVLFEAPTIAHLAALIGTDEASESDSTAAPQSFDYLVPLNSNSDARATPLFIVAGMFGNVLNLRHLALPFSNERPVYGIQARGLIGDLDPHLDACTAAADYLAEVRRRQPEGPYLLSGYSGGGVVAYEMAQQLRNAGEQVAVLALLDSPLPVRPSLTRTDKALIKLAELRRKGPAYLVEWLRNRRAWHEEQRARAGQVEVADGVSFNNDRISSAFIAAMEAYQTQPWEGPITLFRPPLDRHWAVSGGMWVTRAKEYVFEDNDWRRQAPALQVIEVPGDHDSMVLAPNVTVLAQELREIIEASLEAPDEAWQEATAAE